MTKHKWNKLQTGRQICSRCSLMRERSRVPDGEWLYSWERGPRKDGVRAADSKTYCPPTE